MAFDKNHMIKRQRAFVLKVFEMIDDLPNGLVYDTISKQLIRCSTSVGANYRAACRAKSTADFINKLKIVEEEADECLYFLDLLSAVKNTDINVLSELMKEANEFLAITVASIKTAKNNKENK
jgi:four helix bundle protein